MCPLAPLSMAAPAEDHAPSAPAGGAATADAATASNEGAPASAASGTSAAEARAAEAGAAEAGPAEAGAAAAVPMAGSMPMHMPQVRGLLQCWQARLRALLHHGPAPRSRQARRCILGGPPSAQDLRASGQCLLHHGLFRRQVARGLGARARTLVGREGAHARHLRGSANARARN